MAKTKVTFAVGQGFDKDGKEIDCGYDKRKQALTLVAETYGGYSVQDVNGGWINGKGELVEEPSMIITAYTDLENIHGSVAKGLARLFNQESVLLALEPVTSLEFVGQ